MTNPPGSTITATLPKLDLTSLGSPANTEVTATLKQGDRTVAEGRFLAVPKVLADGD